MRGLFWLVLAGCAATIVWLIWHIRRKAEERRLAEEARAAAFMTGLPLVPKPAPGIAAGASVPVPSPVAAPVHDVALQKLLFDAAHKAGEAGEPALAIQLYARLLARYPATGFAGEVRAAVEMLKKKLVKS
jgi:hypothetical protein